MRLLVPLRITAIFLLTCAVCCVSCGIENVVYLYPPRRGYDQSDLVDKSKRYCQFTTSDSDNISSAAEYFQGTEIYYRIYEREGDCTEDRAQIDRHNENNPSTAAQYLQDTKKYFRLRCSNVNANQRPLIAKSSADTVVRFRLQNYGTTDPALLTVSGVSLGIPYRDSQIIATKKEFESRAIAVGDDDVHKASTATTDEYWYVNFYAVAYGYDKAFRTLYSSLAPLGFIRVEKN